MAAPTNAFRMAVEADDHDAIAPLLAEQVTFLSPVAFTPYHGREMVAAILRGASRAFLDFRYEREIRSRDGRDIALVFRARVGDREVHGCDFLRLDDAGLIEEFCVMVRPLSAANALSAAMAEQFEIIGREVGHGR
ncbi:MAG: nuclear transport factor 2 family protein [Actinomycetota bacterium]|nr:nuclear transport factor 2 family protein [Actinomycetota bacterium]